MKRFLSIFFCTLLLLLLFTFCGGILLFDLHENVYGWTLPVSLCISAVIAVCWKMDDKITALQKRVDELEAAQKSTEKPEK